MIKKKSFFNYFVPFSLISFIVNEDIGKILKMQVSVGKSLTWLFCWIRMDSQLTTAKGRLPQAFI
jgi:hypothetical protein